MAIVLIGIGLAACDSGSGSPSSSAGVPHPAPPPEEAKIPSGWRVVLNASIPDPTADGGINVSRLEAGAEGNATDRFDNGLDIRAMLSGSLQVYFDHRRDADYGPFSKQVWNDIRSTDLPQEWALEVAAGSGVTVTLQWTLPDGEVGCGTNRFILEDPTGALPQTDLCDVQSLRYTGDGLVKQFSLRVI